MHSPRSRAFSSSPTNKSMEEDWEWIEKEASDPNPVSPEAKAFPPATVSERMLLEPTATTVPHPTPGPTIPGPAPSPTGPDKAPGPNVPDPAPGPSGPDKVPSPTGPEPVPGPSGPDPTAKKKQTTELLSGTQKIESKSVSTPALINPLIQAKLKELHASLAKTVKLTDELMALDPPEVKEQLELLFGPHSAYSFELIAHLTRDTSHVFSELLSPDKPPLPLDQKDEMAYLDLRISLAKNPPLQELVDAIWTKSSYFKIGEHIGKEAKLPPDKVLLTAVNLNGAWLPEFFFNLLQFNPFLRHNQERARDAIKLFHDLMHHISSLDFIFFEEAWRGIFREGPTRTFLKEQFTQLGYYSFGDEHVEPLSLGSGLLGFSKHPIIDRNFQGFLKRRIGTETLAHKGVEAVKVLLPHDRIITVVLTHQTSGDGFFKKDVKVLGTTSELRSEQQQKEHNLIREYADLPVINPKTGEPYLNLGVLYAADTNKTLNEIYQFIVLSSGGSLFNHRERHDIKYSGDFNNTMDFLSTLPKHAWPIPRNFIDVEIPKEVRELAGKKTDPALEAKAKKENLATGTTYSTKDLKENKKGLKKLTLQTTERRCIDVIMVKPHEKKSLEAFETFVINSVNNKGQAISDHLGLIAFMLFSVKKEVAVLPSLSDKLTLTQFGKAEIKVPSEVKVDVALKGTIPQC